MLLYLAALWISNGHRVRFLATVRIKLCKCSSWLHQKRLFTLVVTTCENLCAVEVTVKRRKEKKKEKKKRQQCISRCGHIHRLPLHLNMFSLCLCPCVSRQDILNYFAQLPPWTLATARQYTHITRTHPHTQLRGSQFMSITRSSPSLITGKTLRGGLTINT